jgi:hypothetical protein
MTFVDPSDDNHHDEFLVNCRFCLYSVLDKYYNGNYYVDINRA